MKAIAISKDGSVRQIDNYSVGDRPGIYPEMTESGFHLIAELSGDTELILVFGKFSYSKNHNFYPQNLK